MAEIIGLSAVGAAGAYVATNVGPKFASAGMSARAAQLHAHKMDDIRFRIERQKLYRQDIRDLMQTGRRSMDTYQKVGTFLFGFTLALFTGSQAYASMFNPNSKVPEWIVAMFSINNVCAIGYLTLSVFLAMHASVISDSVGARLLTSFARLSVPSRRELEQIRTSVIPLPPVRSMLRSGARKIKKMRRSGQALVESQDDDDSLQRQQTWPDLRKEEQSESHHFRRFLKEQHNYIAYDEFSRVCMALGVNHLLATVSYFIIGVVWQRSIVAGAATLAATQLLMLLILRLDVAEDFTESVLSEEFWPLNVIQEYFESIFGVHQSNSLDRPLLDGVGTEDTVSTFGATRSQVTSVPSLTTHVLICVLVAMPPFLGRFVWDMDLLCAAGGFLGTLCFVFHATWLFFIYKMIKIHKEDNLPNFLRTVRYLNVLDVEQRRLAKKERDEHMKEKITSLRSKRLNLQRAINEIMRLEGRSGLTSSTLRSCGELFRLYDHLQDEVNLADFHNTAGFANELRAAEKLLEHCTVWQTSPEVGVNLLALCSPLVRRHLNPEDSREAFRLYGAVTERFRELELAEPSATRDGSEAGIESGRPRKTRSATDLPEDSPAVLRSSSQPDITSNVFSDDLELEGVPRPIIVVGLENMGMNEVGEQPTWIDTESSGVSHTRPQSTNDQERVVQPSQVMDQAAQWLVLASDLQQSLRAHIQETERLHGLEGADLPRDLVDGESTMRSTVSTSVSRMAKAPGWLPRVIVQRLSCGLMFIWTFAAGSHVLRLQTTCAVAAPPHELKAIQLYARALQVDWPEPARLFDVVSLHCSDTDVLVRGRFSTHLAERTKDGLAPLVALDASAANGFCDINGCGSLPLSSRNASLELVPDAVLPTFGAAESTLANWRIVASSAPSCKTPPCPVRVAAWDGKDVVVASAWHGNAPGQWRVQPQFALRAPAGNNYDHVTALQLGEVGRTLLVLSSQGELDGWDLKTGELFGRWQLYRPAHAMCQSGPELLFVREESRGPVLEASPWQSRLV